MKNLDMPAEPNMLDPQTAAYMEEFDGSVGVAQLGRWNSGLTKREYACIHCGVPATGDPDLDAIIAEGNRIQKAMIDAPLMTGKPDKTVPAPTPVRDFGG